MEQHRFNKVVPLLVDHSSAWLLYACDVQTYVPYCLFTANGVRSLGQVVYDLYWESKLANLSRLLQSSSSEEHNEALLALQRNLDDDAAQYLFRTSNFLGRLVALLDSSIPKVQEHALGLLVKLTIVCESDEAVASLALDAGMNDVIPRLVTLLDCSRLQLEASDALYHIASNTSSRQVIIATQGSLEKLVSLLASPTRYIQGTATGALSNLALDVETMSRITLLEGCTEKLSSLVLSPHIEVAGNAAGALCNLEGLVGTRGMVTSLERLVLLTRSSNPVLQRTAAGSLKCLAQDAQARNQILRTKGSLEELMDLLGSPDLEVREEAGAALRSLAIDDADKRRVAGIVRGNLPKRLYRSFMQFCSLEVAEGEELLKTNGALKRLPLVVGISVHVLSPSYVKQYRKGIREGEVCLLPMQASSLCLDQELYWYWYSVCK